MREGVVPASSNLEQTQAHSFEAQIHEIEVPGGRQIEGPGLN